MAGSESAPALVSRDTELEWLHNFASTTVHHLREPVRMIVSYSDMLSETAGFEGEDRRCLTFLQNAAAQMQNLLEGLSEVSSASHRAVQTSTVRLDVPLRQAMLECDTEMKAALANVTFQALPLVNIDLDRLQTVFRHLLQNALRYRGAAKPEITVTATDTGSEWTVKFHDNGPGIESRYHAKIFQLYWRLHGREIPGNGLGLPICQMLVEAHGGRIWIESSPGQGTSILFTLPRL